MTKTQLRQKVDELGALREQLTSLGAAERALSDEVRQAMSAADVAALEASEYAAQLAERRTLKVEPAAFRRKAGEELFLACARIDVREARRHFNDQELAKLGEYETRLELRVSRRPNKARG